MTNTYLGPNTKLLATEGHGIPARGTIIGAAYHLGSNPTRTIHFRDLAPNAGAWAPSRPVDTIILYEESHREIVNHLERAEIRVGNANDIQIPPTGLLMSTTKGRDVRLVDVNLNSAYPTYPKLFPIADIDRSIIAFRAPDDTSAPSLSFYTAVYDQRTKNFGTTGTAIIDVHYLTSAGRILSDAEMRYPAGYETAVDNMWRRHQAVPVGIIGDDTGIMVVIDDELQTAERSKGVLTLGMPLLDKRFN